MELIPTPRTRKGAKKKLMKEQREGDPVKCWRKNGGSKKKDPQEKQKH